MLALAGAKDVTQLVVALAEPASGAWTLEPTHRPVAAFDAAMVLLQTIIQVAAGTVPHRLAQRRPNCPRVAVVPISGDPVRCDAGDRLG